MYVYIYICIYNYNTPLTPFSNLTGWSCSTTCRANSTWNLGCFSCEVGIAKQNVAPATGEGGENWCLVESANEINLWFWNSRQFIAPLSLLDIFFSWMSPVVLMWCGTGSLEDSNPGLEQKSFEPTGTDHCGWMSGDGMDEGNKNRSNLGGGNSKIFYIFTPILGVSWSNLTYMFSGRRKNLFSDHRIHRLGVRMPQETHCVPPG